MSDIHQVFSVALKSPKIPIKYGFLVVVASMFNSRLSINDSKDSWDWLGERYKTIKLQSLFSILFQNLCIAVIYVYLILLKVVYYVTIISDQTSGLTGTFNDTQGALEHSRHSESTRKHGYLEGTRACRNLGHLNTWALRALRYFGT